MIIENEALDFRSNIFKINRIFQLVRCAHAQTFGILCYINVYWKWRHDTLLYDTWFACVWIHNRECCQFLGEDGLSLRMLFSRVAPFGVLWTLTSYLYLQGLRRIPATDACALFCCSRAFVFLISWIVLRDRFMGVRVSLWYINRSIKTCNYGYTVVCSCD